MRVRKTETEIQILRSDINIFFAGALWRKNRHRHSLRGSIRTDVDLVGLLARASPDRSNLPGAFVDQWRARLDPLRLQWLGRSGVKPDSHTTPSHKFYTGWKGASQIRIIMAGRDERILQLACFMIRAVKSFDKSLPASRFSRLPHPQEKQTQTYDAELSAKQHSPVVV